MATFQADIALILLAQAGDRAALAELFKVIQQPLQRYLVTLLGNSHLAEDVLQEVFVLIWKKLGWLRDPTLFQPWVYRIASREGFRRLKRDRVWSRQIEATELDLIADSAEEESPPFDLGERLPAAVSAISPASRATLCLHYQDGMTLEEVSEVLDIPLGTVKSRLAYGLKRLREQLTGKAVGHE